MGRAEPDLVVTDPDDDDTVLPLCTSRTKTAEQLKPGHRITIDLDDADALADFLQEISRLVRSKRRLTVVIE